MSRLTSIQIVPNIATTIFNNPPILMDDINLMDDIWYMDDYDTGVIPKLSVG